MTMFLDSYGILTGVVVAVMVEITVAVVVDGFLSRQEQAVDTRAA